jgi:murein DD-endopeptidase MepM/ murein hydrolase activator NlpD
MPRLYRAATFVLLLIGIDLLLVAAVVIAVQRDSLSLDLGRLNPTDTRPGQAGLTATSRPLIMPFTRTVQAAALAASPTPIPPTVTASQHVTATSTASTTASATATATNTAAATATKTATVTPTLTHTPTRTLTPTTTPSATHSPTSAATTVTAAPTALTITAVIIVAATISPSATPIPPTATFVIYPTTPAPPSATPTPIPLVPAETPVVPVAAAPAFTECAPHGLPVNGILTQYYSFYHSGIDLAVARGSMVATTHSGTVTFAGWSWIGYGYLVVVQSGRYSTWYGHNTHLNVSAGETVTIGQMIASSGSTGRATGPHVHYEVRVDNRPVDPLKFEREAYTGC